MFGKVLFNVMRYDADIRRDRFVKCFGDGESAYAYAHRMNELVNCSIVTYWVRKVIVS